MTRRTLGAVDRTSSGRVFPRPGSSIYTERSRFPKWNVKPSATMEPRLLKRRLPDWTKADHCAAARAARADAVRLDRAWNAALRTAERKHGTAGSLISCGLRPGWPDAVKGRVRTVCHAFWERAAEAHAHEKAGGCKFVGVPFSVERKTRK